MRLIAYLGPDKAGSTWLYRYLHAHPAVATAGSKETFYFDRYHGRGFDWYRSQFPSDATTIADVSHDYLFDPAVADRLHDAPLDVRCVVFARHPFDRAESAYQYMRLQGRVQMPFGMALRHVDELLDHGMYWKHLEPFVERLGWERVSVIDFDLLRADPTRVADLVDALGGISAAHRPVLPTREIALPARSSRRPALTKLARGVVKFGRDVGANRLVQRLKNSAVVERTFFTELRDEDRAESSEADIAFARERLEEDARALDGHLGTSFASTWWGDDSPDGSGQSQASENDN